MDATVLIASLYGTGRTTFTERGLNRSVAANHLSLNALHTLSGPGQESSRGRTRANAERSSGPWAADIADPGARGKKMPPARPSRNGGQSRV